MHDYTIPATKPNMTMTFQVDKSDSHVTPTSKEWINGCGTQDVHINTPEPQIYSPIHRKNQTHGRYNSVAIGGRWSSQRCTRNKIPCVLFIDFLQSRQSSAIFMLF